MDDLDELIEGKAEDALAELRHAVEAGRVTLPSVAESPWAQNEDFHSSRFESFHYWIEISDNNASRAAKLMKRDGDFGVRLKLALRPEPGWNDPDFGWLAGNVGALQWKHEVKIVSGRPEISPDNAATEEPFEGA